MTLAQYVLDGGSVSELVGRHALALVETVAPCRVTGLKLPPQVVSVLSLEASLNRLLPREGDDLLVCGLPVIIVEKRA